MTKNERIALTFAAQFSPPLLTVRTDTVHGEPAPGAYTCSHWDIERSLGVTAIVQDGKIRAFLEAVGEGEIAASAGRVLAEALGRFKAR